MNRMTRLRSASLAAALVMTTQLPSAYVLKTAKWNSSPVPFYVNTQNLDLSPESVLSAVQFGAYAWTNQSTAAFSFYYAGTTSSTTVTNNGQNEIFFRDASNGTAIATTYTYSSGGRILDTDIVFWDAAFTFFSGSSGCSSGFYVEDIAAHEFGHALGLAHSTVGDATMYPSIGYCSMEMRSLSDDDLQGVEALYPGGSSNTAPAVQITSPAASSFAYGTAVTFAGSASDAEDGDLAAALVWVSSRDGDIGTGPTFQRVLSAGSHTVTARATDSGGAIAESRVDLTIEAPAAANDSGISISLRGYKVRGWQNVDVSWSGASSLYVDIYRNGTKIATIGNSGGYTDAINKKGAGAYTYIVCEANMATCSNPSGVTF